MFLVPSRSLYLRLMMMAMLSLQVLKAYETEGFDMVLQALNDEKYLPRLTGLDELYAEGQKALEEVDWDVDEGEGEDDF